MNVGLTSTLWWKFLMISGPQAADMGCIRCLPVKAFKPYDSICMTSNIQGGLGIFISRHSGMDDMDEAGNADIWTKVQRHRPEVLMGKYS